jgi:hypothetical protein
MIFATFNRQMEPLTDFLGPAMKWMDLFMKQGRATRCRRPPPTASASRQLEDSAGKYHRWLSLSHRT